jgi:type 1 glutamine amidotransferase
MEVPPEGVHSDYVAENAVTQHLFGAREKILLVTGHHHPGHDWKATTPVIRSAISSDPDLHVDITTSIGDLGEIQLSDYGAIILNYCNWEISDPLGQGAKERLLSFVSRGGGLIAIHFANGAFHYSLPGAEQSDWPEYREIVRRVWDHHSDSAHDAYGPFVVTSSDIQHPITDGLEPFETTDELYYNQKGDLPIDVLLTARSVDTGRDEPVAFTYQYGEGRVFQTLLGHDAASLDHPSMREVLRRSARWAVGL